jgi:hypothetical protein
MRGTGLRAFVLVLVAWTIGTVGNGTLEAKTKFREVTGEIVSTDAAANSLVVKTKKGEMTVTVDSKTQIVVGKEEIHLSDLRAGQKVKIYYTHAGGRDLAERIMVKALTQKR